MKSTELPKVLCVDDEPGVLQSLSRLLKSDFTVLTADSAEKGLELAKENLDLAVIVSDYRMPGKNGVEFLKEMKAICPTAARTILSGQIDINELSHAINSAEINRFFLKPWENDYLKLQIHEAVQTHINLSEKTHFKYLSITDPITGLYNHRYFQDQLREIIELEKNGALVMADVDHFKSYNDRYGHPEGDRLLQEIGSSLKELVGQSGFVARYGGEEFALLLPNKTAQQAYTIAEAVREKLASRALAGPGRDSYVTVSLGVSSFPEHTTQPELLIQMADDALYLSKSQGRNCTTVASS